MMLQTKTQTDPIVEILRLAYRRGLAIQQEKANKIVNLRQSEENILITKPEHSEKVEKNLSK